MRKKNFAKLFLVLMVMATLTIFLSGCTADDEIIVRIKVDDDWEYKIYVDGHPLGTTDDRGNLTIYDVITTGNHLFEAEDTSSWNCSGFKEQLIKNGFNTVHIQVECDIQTKKELYRSDRNKNNRREKILNKERI